MNTLQIYPWRYGDLHPHITQHLATNVLKIETLDLTRCKGITDQGLIKLSEQLRKPKDLKELNLRFLQYPTSVGLSAIASSCPNLTSLSVSSYAFIFMKYIFGRAPIQDYSFFQHLPKLISLDLGDISYKVISWDQLLLVSKHCVNIERLGVSGTSKMS